MKKCGIILALLFLPAFLYGCGDTPEEVVREYLKSTSCGDYLEAKSLCTGDAFTETKSAEGAAESRGGFSYEFFTDWSKVEPSLEFTVTKKTSEEAKVLVSADNYEITTYTLTKVKGTWKISEAEYPGRVWSRIYTALDL